MRHTLIALLLCLLAGCVAGPPDRAAASAPMTPQESTMSAIDPPRGTAFALPAAYPGRLATTSITAADVTLPDVPGLRLGTFEGLQALLIETPHSTAAIALFGGHLLSFVPTGQTDALWVSPTTAGPPQPIRGGTPIVWPYFSKQDQDAALPSHGFVRTLRWQLDTARREADGTMVVVLSPPVFEDLALRVRTELRIGRTLEQRLITDNVGDAPVRITQALHTYFRVSDVTRVRVTGLDGLTYLDKNDGFAAHLQRGDWDLHDPRDPGRSDRIYGGAGGRYVLEDPQAQRRIELEVEGSRTLVVWNPGEVSASRSTDMGDGLWRGFLCLEAANAGPEYAEIAAGASHTLLQRIRVLPLSEG